MPPRLSPACTTGTAVTLATTAADGTVAKTEFQPATGKAEL